MKTIKTPLTVEEIKGLKAGDEVSLTGRIYTARDQAHARMQAAIRGGKKLPFELRGQVIYYCGPTATPKGKVIGSCGPTTARRMDAYAPILLTKGLAGMIGKGGRSDAVRRAIQHYKGVYFVTHAGCGALLSQFVGRSAVIGYKDLGPEAVRRLEVEKFPLIVAIDSRGKSIYRGVEG